MADSFRTFEDLDCWKKCRELRMYVVKKVVPLLPKEEKYRLGDQLIRSARSTTANVAEAYGRYHYQENIQFCRNARGSAYEVLDHVISAVDEGLLPADTLKETRNHIAHAVRTLNGYIRYLRKQKESS